jgi:hypothetical protein
MRYIKSVDEYSINEELSIKIGWKEIIVGLCLFVAYKNYFPAKKKITLGEMNKIINDIDSKPMLKEKTTIDGIKNSLILDIKQDNKISTDKKKKLIEGIYNIPFVMVDTETITLITGKENTLGCYFGYMDTVRNKMVTMILVNRERIKLGVHFNEIILHELRHLVDDLLTDGRKEYSELSNIIDILDKDIVLRNEEGERKLRNKVNDFVDIMVKKTVDPKKINLEEVKQLTKDIKEDYFDIIYLNKKDMDYLTSSSEIYVRFHGLKRWMIKKGYLKDMNSEITQDIIMRMMQSKDFYDLNTSKKDFFQLLFYMDVDFTGKTKSDVSKLNSIVANYKDYISNEKPA